MHRSQSPSDRLKLPLGYDAWATLAHAVFDDRCGSGGLGGQPRNPLVHTPDAFASLLTIS